MGKLYIARRAQRKGLLLPMEGSKGNPSIMFPLSGTESSEIDELVRAMLEKQGIHKESDINGIIEKAEVDSENRIKVAEARAEVRRLMKERAEGKSLMQVGYRKWKVAYYPAIHRLGGDIDAKGTGKET